MIKLLLLAVLNAMLHVNAGKTCHYEALAQDSSDCPDETSMNFNDEVGDSADYDGLWNGTPECPLDLSDAATMFEDGILICEADIKLHMTAYEAEFENAEWGTADKSGGVPGTDGNLDQYPGWDTRPEGTDKDEDNCNDWDMYYIRCVEETCTDGIQNQDETGVDCGGVCDACAVAVGGDDCKPLDEAGCAAQPDSCHAKTRSGIFRKCKPKRCKPMTESQCEAAVHCEKKMGRRGEYKKCRRA